MVLPDPKGRSVVDLMTGKLVSEIGDGDGDGDGDGENQTGGYLDRHSHGNEHDGKHDLEHSSGTADGHGTGHGYGHGYGHGHGRGHKATDVDDNGNDDNLDEYAEVVIDAIADTEDEALDNTSCDVLTMGSTVVESNVGEADDVAVARLWVREIDTEPVVDTIVDIEDETFTSNSGDDDTVESTPEESAFGAEEDVALPVL